MFPDLARHTEKLIYFYEMIQNGSLQGTSRKLGISAPTLSYTLKELELAVGTPLFTRSRKGIEPTAAGEKLAVFCRKLYRDLDELDLGLREESTVKRKVRVGTFSSIAIYFWPLLQAELKGKESLSVSITTRRSREIIEALVKKEVDLAITVGSLQHPDIVRHELYHDQYAFFVSQRRKKQVLTAEDVRSEVLLYIPDAQDEKGNTLRSQLHQMGLWFGEEYELDSLDVISAFVKKGAGIGILPEIVARNTGSGLKRASVPGLGRRAFGDHVFYLSYRRDLELRQSDLHVIMDAASRAVRNLSR